MKTAPVTGGLLLVLENDLIYHRQQFVAITTGAKPSISKHTRLRGPMPDWPLMLQSSPVLPGKPWAEPSQCGPAEEQRCLPHRPR